MADIFDLLADETRRELLTTLHATRVHGTPGGELSVSELVEKLEVDLSALEPDARDRLLAVVSRAIDASCTVGRTIKSGATVTLSVIDEATGETVSHSSENGI